MTADRQERLYNLLPALYRELDEREGQPLRALMAVLESEYRRLEWDTEAMWDDWFIETCDLWVVPYIADLLGIRHLQDMNHIPHQRRLVANTIAYRRRKGTLAILEQVTRDATGWYARSVEYGQLVAKTQHVGYTQPDRGRTVDVRRLHGATEIDGPMDALAHTLDVDKSDRGRYNAEHVGLFAYRLRSYPIRRSFADRCRGRPGCFTFDPLGRDIRLFNRPEPVADLSQRTQPANLPLRLSRADLEDDLAKHRALYRHVPKNYQPDESCYYGPDRSLYIELPGGEPKIKPTAVVSMDLDPWPPALSIPAGEKRVKAVVAVDVERGRLAFIDHRRLPESKDLDVEQDTVPLEHRPSYVVVSYNYGFSSEIGGGPYHREVPLPQPAESLFQINVARGADQGAAGEVVPGCVSTLQEALTSWEGQKNRCGVIRILDNGVYDEQLEIKLPKGSGLSIVAGSGVRPIIGKRGQPLVVCPEATEGEAGAEAGSGVRRIIGKSGQPLVVDPEATEGEARAEAGRGLHLSGLLLLGGLQIRSPGQAEAEGGLTVTVGHCTLASLKAGRLKLAPIQSEQAQGLDLSIEHSILGALYLPDKTEKVTVSYSIVDNGSGYAIAADEDGKSPGPALKLERVTIFGQVHARQVEASEVIFGGLLKAPGPEKNDQIRHSYVPPLSITLEDKAHPSILRDVPPPRFTSTQYGDPGYAQLSLDCPREIRGGAADGAEMGALHDLYQLQAEQNLREVLEEYLPLGLQASIHYVT